MGLAKLFWSAPCCAVENQGEQEEGFVKMKKDQVAKCACVCACLSTQNKRKWEITKLLIC